MKTVVSVSEISELDIKPLAESMEWKKILLEEIKNKWQNKTGWIDVPCPVCGSSDCMPAFNKFLFEYAECKNCKTLYASSRPPGKELTLWYGHSIAAEFWQENILKSSESSRNEKIIEPRAQWITDAISEYMHDASSRNIKYTDISFYGRMLNEKISELNEQLVVTAAGITAGKEGYQGKKIRVVPLNSINDLTGLDKTDILVAIDVFDRITSIQSFLEQVSQITEPGALVFAACPVSSGLEIQALWNESPSIIPPDKLNFPSVEGLISLFSASGKWEIMELSTPGMFDVQLVRQALERNAGQWPRVVRALFEHMDDTGDELFTGYLQSQRLSSFARIVLKRK